MRPIDFSGLLDVPTVLAVLPAGAKLSHRAYEEEGLQFRCEAQADDLIQEFVRIADDAFLLATDCAPRGERKHVQIVNRSDWVHVQLRLSGGGRERVDGKKVIETPDNACVITRYPQDATIERCFDEADRWRSVCLLMTPKALVDLLGAPASRLPGSVQWLTLDGSPGGVSECLSVAVPMLSTLEFVGNDILCCSLQGRARHVYMRAKSLELLAILVDALQKESDGQMRAAVKLSAADNRAILLARMIMMRDLESPITLAQLARRVGLNRTKLALGFKQVYGASVQAYWRDIRLSRARTLLRVRGARVTDVAIKMGYAELSSFSRAFNRKFGVLPRHCKDPVD